MTKLRALRFSAVAFGAAGLLAAAGAEAQSLSLGPDSTIRRKVALRSGDVTKRYWINQKDCLLPDVITFQVTLLNYAGLNLEVWAGTDKCTDPAQRTATTARCKRVYFGAASQQQQSVPINARNIVDLNTTATSTTTTSPGPVTVPGPDVCTGNAGQQSLGFYFMLTDTLSNIQGNASAVWQGGGYDIAPPAAPTSVDASGGEDRIHFKWTRSADPDVLGYNLYCDSGSSVFGDASVTGAAFHPSFGLLAVDGSVVTRDGGLGGAPAILDAGRGGAGGLGGVGGASGGAASVDAGRLDAAISDAAKSDGQALSSCATGTRLPTTLIPGAIPPDALYCGYVAGITADTGSADGLLNDTPYVVAVATIDKVYNVGPLSNLACATPMQITDFFELYKDFGGKGGGGFCSTSPRKRPLGGPLFVLGAAAAASAWRRRRERG